MEGLKDTIGPDSRIRSVFRQTDTRTGRISSAEPNMQNIPIRTEPGSRMRDFFEAEEGNLLVDFHTRSSCGCWRPWPMTAP